MSFQVSGNPHLWPQDETTPATACALVVVDMQHDYCSPGFYMDRAGYDTIRLSEPVARIQAVLAAARRGGLSVIYTRHGRLLQRHQSGQSESDWPQTAVRGEPGWQIVPALSPAATDTIIEKSTCSAFISGELDHVLRQKGITHLALCGNTIDVCVHSTLRTAVDLGYKCLLLADCCAAVNDELHRWSVESVKIENGVFGSVANAQAFINALTHGR
jgi:biuret amidohydrolase